MEKEMLGLYITGHPLEELRADIELQTDINTFKMKEAMEAEAEGGKNDYKDGQIIKIAGIVSSVKKKFTKTNKIMAFVTLEDLYGSCEIIVFENSYLAAQELLVEDSVVLVEGRLSIREDDETKIVANKITKFGAKAPKCLSINITNLDEKQKEKLRGAIKFFAGDRNNIAVKIINGENAVMAGGIYLNDDILNEFSQIVGTNLVLEN